MELSLHQCMHLKLRTLTCRDVVDLDSIDRTSMACPALPTCGLAVTESERSLPDINLRIRALMTKLGFDEGESFVVRMTGASCAREHPTPLQHLPTMPSRLSLGAASMAVHSSEVIQAPTLSVCAHERCGSGDGSGGVGHLARHPTHSSHANAAGRADSGCANATRQADSGCVQAQAARTAVRGRIWRSWALWATVPTATSSGSAAAPTRRAWQRSFRTA